MRARVSSLLAWQAVWHAWHPVLLHVAWPSLVNPHLSAPKAEEEQPDWKPALALAAAGAAKQPLLATRFYVDAGAGTPGRFVVGDMAGELAAVDAASYSAERRVGAGA